MASHTCSSFRERVMNASLHECVIGSRKEVAVAARAAKRAAMWQQRGIELNNERTRQQFAVANELGRNTQLAITNVPAPASVTSTASNAPGNNPTVAHLTANAPALLAAIPAHLQAEADASCDAHLADLDTRAAAASAEAANSPDDAYLSSKAEEASNSATRAHQRAKLSTKVCVHCHKRYSFNDTLRRHLKDVHYKTMQPYSSLSRADRIAVSAAEAP